MSKKSHKALASATVMSLVLTSTLAATNVQAAAEVTRMPGADRYTTAQTVAKKSFGKAENVILVNGLGYADSVSATPFAKLKNAPILLTDASDKPSADLTATLTELGAKNIYIVGGKGVVTEAMEKELAKNYKVERIGGNSRYETNAEIAKKVIAETKAEKAILVNGQDGYADALSVASVAATKGYPVIFGNKNNVPTVVKDAVKDVKEVLAVGGEGVLPDAVIKGLEAKRIAKGADRFDTNLKVLEHFNADFKFDNIFVAAGGDDSTSKFADALVASAAAAKHGAPVVLTGLGANKDNVDKSVKYVKGKMGDNTKVTIVGGTASVSEAIEKDLKGEKESTGKAEVQSMEALNLNQVKIVFNDKVDEDTAEDIRNYEIDGTQFTKEDADNKKAIAVLQDDDKTVILTMVDSQSQEKEKEVKVRKGILTADKKKLVKEKEMKVTFKDTKAPTVKKVEAKGNSKLTIEFSEPVLVNGDDPVKTLAEQIEINGNTIKSIGYNDDKEYSKLKDYVKNDDVCYTNKVQFYFDSSLDNGTNKLTVPEGEKDSYLVDAAGFNVKETNIDFKVDEVTSRPKVKSVKGSTDGKIYINFDRAMDEKTVKEGIYKLNGSPISIGNGKDDAKVELKEKDTQIKLTGVQNILTGSNTIEVGNKVRDAYGNKVESDLRVSFNASKDEAKPKVANVLTVDDSTLRVVFNKDVSKSSANHIKNYTLRDSKGSKVSLEDVTFISDSIYDINLASGSKLDGSKYTLKIESISDLAGNVMDEYTATINGEEVTPEVKHAIKVNTEKDNKVVVVFESEMKASSINKLDNYKYKNGKGDVKSLPSDAKITVESDNKTVTIEFPTSYTIYTEDDKNIPSEANAIKNIIVTKNVQSANGTKMDADETVRIKDHSKAEASVSLDEEPMTLKEDKGNAVVSVKFNGAVKKADFDKDDKDKKVKDVTFFDKSDDKKTIKVRPMNITTNGEKVEFKFNDEDSDKIKAIGVDLAIKIEKNGEKDALTLTDAAGIKIDLNTNKLQGIDKNEIAPEIIYEKNSNDYVIANKKDEFKSWEVNREKGTVTIKFNTKLREGSADINDFEFTGDKGKLEVKSATVKGNTVVYEFKGETDKDDKKAFKDSSELKVKLNKDKQTIESKSDENGDRIAFDKDSIGNETLKVKLSDLEDMKEEDG